MKWNESIREGARNGNMNPAPTKAKPTTPPPAQGVKAQAMSLQPSQSAFLPRVRGVNRRLLLQMPFILMRVTLNEDTALFAWRCSDYNA